MADATAIPESCDYLVIGAGSGGCAAAGRIAAETDASIVLVESGGSNDREDVIRPSGWPELLASDANWGYETLPQAGTEGKVHVWTMGKVLGGSSAVNGMMFMRGAPWDYDKWAAEGNAGWDSESVYKAFRELESYPDGGPDRGQDGPLRITKVDGANPLTNAFLEACQECGHPRSKGFNGYEPEGVDTQQLNIWEGRRQDAAVAFLEPQLQEGNLEVLLETTAERLVFDSGSRRVTEVVLNRGGERRSIRVDGEVIVAAGAIASPQLLLLSGVGPADELRRLGIEVEIDLPGVGSNLHDHIGVPVPFETKGPYPGSEYQLVEANLYCRSDAGEPHYDVQIPFQLFPYVPPGFDGYEFEFGYTLFPGILKPRSRGSVSLRSSDPTEPPLVDPGYLSDEDDVRRLASAIGIAREVGGAAAFSQWREREALPGQNVKERKDLETYVRRSASTYYHPVGTCKMGSGGEAVVGSDLKVHGAENLRVADASIMPEVPSGNTNIPAMMVGWRAGDLILASTPVSSESAA
ncbi:MAG TPA: GMC family oxidoreductase N-terminal domain-containing protein [Solirubrobacterales bacterium]|jgi:choline dehydrogenase